MKRIMLITVALTAVLSLSAGMSVAGGVPWKYHQYPNDFVFGNHLDTHQQSRVMSDYSLRGHLYVEFTGEYTDDGLPVAKHSDCDASSGECSVGWQWVAVPGEATFVYHDGSDHPIWLLDSRSDLPQPGSYSHFHWTGGPEMAGMLVPGVRYSGYFLKLMAKDTFAFVHGGEPIPVFPGVDNGTHLNIVFSFPGY